MDASAKQQVVERLKQAQNILVTVSTNPSVDQLAACIGLTLLLNKTGKHATAVFSGTVPSTLEFLQPEKTIETTTDSLRDFIISLDKDKADKLRYKVEEDVVKIFITPYRSSLSQKDLVFSQGDFNVEAVMALGVKDKSQLDAAITAHGRILHDATVIAVNAGEEKGAAIGQINWQEPTASSLSEMIVSISEALGSNLIDNQMATAFLTGIVAETKRFANAKTSPKVMTMSAQLMAAGANQQLIVNKLEAQTEIKLASKTEQPSAQLAETEGTKPAGAPDGELSVDHSNDVPKTESTVEAEAKPAKAKPQENEIKIDQEGNLKKADESDEMKPPSMPGSHALLTSNDGGPMLATPFSANTESGFGAPASDSTDPFAEPTAGNPGILTHAKTVNPTPLDNGLGFSKLPEPAAAEEPHVDKARSAVENAYAAAPFDPAGNPVESLNAAPLEPETAAEPESAESAAPPDQPAPPPVPPPLTLPTPGVVIPSNPAKPNPAGK